MLKYSIKLSNDNFKENELVWGEKYLDPNLSFVSGVTDASNHLEKFDKVNISNSLINSSAIVSVETENATREGYVVVSGKTYNVHKDEYIDYSVNQSGDTIKYSYVFINGKYYYGNGDGNSTFKIDNWLVEQDNDVSIGSITKECEDDVLKLDTIYWIENGNVTIDGDTYLYDINRNELYIENINDNDSIPYSSITDCDGILCHHYNSSCEYKDITKFKLVKDDELKLDIENITYCRYFFYVLYKNHYCPIFKVTNKKGYDFKCEIPNGVLNPNSDVEGVTMFPIYYVSESSDGVLTSGTTPISSTNVSEHGVYDLTDLKNVTAYAIIDGHVFYVENDLQNSNDGKEIAVYLESSDESVLIGDVLRFRDMSMRNFSLKLESQSGDCKEFVVFENKKYYVEDNLCDKVVINNVEYDIDYINGKTVGKDCLVRINDENVPFKIIEGYKLERYGRIIDKESSAATISKYDISNYSGVTINGIKRIIRDGYAEIYDDNREYLFVVDDIKGSSLLICTPYFSDSEFGVDFMESKSKEICDTIIENKDFMYVFSKNKVFGEKKITKDLALTHVEKPNSSDDYYNLFNDLTIFQRSGFINIPLQITSKCGGNPLQSEIVENDFFKKEAEKSINPIVDMEKDVYCPKYIDNEGNVNKHKYNGSSTTFKPIREINLNFHFRTRNSDNWKVNEGYNDKETSGTSDNWFVTDYQPYHDLLKLSGVSGDNAKNVLQETSDLMGLLFFTNYDIYYQKSKVAKSFARLSFYDSTDPQTQQLLATSTVFMDEHMLFQKFINNSRKNINTYGIIEEYDGSKNGETTFKVSVRTEYLWKKRENEKSYTFTSTTLSALTEDDRRISSRMTIKNKYESDTSSEGFYIYMFKEYSENLRPKPIYMKVEFNHAGVGKTIPFTIPMHWSGDTEQHISGVVNPTSALTVGSDEMKKGYPLSYVYAQSYIPLYAVYDFKNKEYAYVFDDRYFINSSKNKIYDNGIVNLNLFEMKIQNETETETSEYIIMLKQKAISNRQQVKAEININTEQFDIEDLNCNRNENNS